MDSISIHSLRMEGDVFENCNRCGVRNFNPLPPHGGRRRRHCMFQRNAPYFNPLPPHGGRLVSENHAYCGAFISIHSLRMEGDSGTVDTCRNLHAISIHSLRMEGDRHIDMHHITGRYFNPLPPHGGRRSAALLVSTLPLFQSTPSAWRETH